jgi:hypothetical protein
VGSCSGHGCSSGKTSNDFNEQWNIWTSGGYVMRKIVTTCIPAWW